MLVNKNKVLIKVLIKKEVKVRFDDIKFMVDFVSFVGNMFNEEDHFLIISEKFRDKYENLKDLLISGNIKDVRLYLSKDGNFILYLKDEKDYDDSILYENIIKFMNEINFRYLDEWNEIIRMNGDTYSLNDVKKFMRYLNEESKLNIVDYLKGTGISLEDHILPELHKKINDNINSLFNNTDEYDNPIDKDNYNFLMEDDE